MVNAFSDAIYLSQVASELSWQFLLDGEGKLTEPETQVSSSALNLCKAVKAAEMLATGQDAYEPHYFKNMPSLTRRLIQVERKKRDFDPTKFSKISAYTCKYENILDDSASGKRKLNDAEIELLRTHFSRVASTLVDMDL